MIGNPCLTKTQKSQSSRTLNSRSRSRLADLISYPIPGPDPGGTSRGASRFSVPSDTWTLDGLGPWME